MWVEFGNANAIEGFRDPAQGADAPVQHRAIEGEQVTTITFPEGVSVAEAFATASAMVNHHFDVKDADTGERYTPVWVDSDSEGLKALLVENFKIENNTRPEGWGQPVDQTEKGE